MRIVKKAMLIVEDNEDMQSLLTSIFEGFGMVLLEAMACERPIICSNISTAREVLGDSGAAIFFEPGNEVDLVLEKDGNLIPIEIKASHNTSRSDYKNIKWFQKLYRIKNGLLINQNKENHELDDGIININWSYVVDV